MAVRGDLTVEWNLSPRVITVAAPSTEITIQDLHDTCRTIEASNEAMDEKVLIDSSGYENLGGGTKVGITATLQNALVAFEARLGPTYEQCSVSGGNLVAVDDVGVTIKTPISPTAFTQVVTTASSSATQSEQEALQYASFQNGVWIDALSQNSGTEFPNGSREFPVNNGTDAILIANGRGFDRLFIIGNYTFTADHNINSFTIEGQNAAKSNITIEDGAQAILLELFEAHVTGVLDGGSTLRECLVDNLNYVNGFIHQCILNPGIIVLGGNNVAFIMDSFSGVAGVSTPIIDMGGSGQGLAMRNYSGGIQLNNMNGSDSVSIDLLAGQVVLDTTVTSGTIIVRGNGKIVDTSGNHILTGTWNGGVNVINETPGVLHQHTLDSIGDAVWSHTQ